VFFRPSGAASVGPSTQKAKSAGDVDLKRGCRAARAWYGSKNPPVEDILAAVEAIDPDTQILYDHTTEEEGEYDTIVKGLYDRMDSLKRNATEFRTWTEEDGMEAFFEVLTDVAPAELRSRVQILQHLGVFKFRKMDGPDEKKTKISAVFAAPGGDEDYKTLLRSQAKRLSAIWVPKPDSLLEFIISQPAQVGRVMADRLSPTNEQPLKLIGHPFTEVRSTELQALAESKTVAYEKEGEIHLLMAVRPVLENWDQDAASSGGCEQFSLLDALLLHEVAEVILDETGELEPLEAHIIASTFERYLKGEMLNVAAEDFFLAWPPLSNQEIAERSKAGLAQQLEEMSAFMGEDEVPDDLDDDLDDLPMDTEVSAPKKKVKVKKKIVRTKDGKKKIVKVVSKKKK